MGKTPAFLTFPLSSIMLFQHSQLGKVIGTRSEGERCSVTGIDLESAYIRHRMSTKDRILVYEIRFAYYRLSFSCAKLLYTVTSTFRRLGLNCKLIQFRDSTL